jgi:CubicO group peptidase (beta-lactamase class C family)
VAFTGTDQLMGNDARWALGYAIGRPGGDPEQTLTVIGMGGAGGTMGYADTATGVAFALCKNRLTPDFSTSERIGDIVARATA